MEFPQVFDKAIYSFDFLFYCNIKIPITQFDKSYNLFSKFDVILQ